MSENQPRQFDAVLGGNTPPPVTGVVLGGIEGVKRRLESEIVDVRIKALSDGLNYGNEGLDLVIEALEDDSLQVKGFASRLLKEFGGEKGKRALLEFDPYLYFTKLDDWEVEEFDSEVGIVNPEGKAYVVNLEKLQLLIQDDRVNEVEALICYLQDDNSYYDVSQEYYDILYNNRNSLENLKALFLGDEIIREYKISYVTIGDIYFLLEGYPNLEVLHIRGFCFNLQFSEILNHNNLKTLVIETSYLPKSATKQIIELDLPNLEYLELWFGEETFDARNLIPKISRKFKKLKYLGIRSCEYTDVVVEDMVSSSLIRRLKILDFSWGTMTDKGVEYLINCPAVNQLHTLDVSMNYISDITGLEQLACHVIAQPQDYNYDNRFFALHE